MNVQKKIVCTLEMLRLFVFFDLEMHRNLRIFGLEIYRNNGYFGLEMLISCLFCLDS